MTVDSGGFEIAGDTAESIVDEIRAFNATLERLRERRLTEIAISGPFLRSKLAWKIATYQQPVLYRVVMLASGCAANWNSRNLLCAYLAARALVETVAVFCSFEADLRKLIENADLGGIDTLVMSRTFATRDAELVQLHPDTKAVNILTFVDKLEKEGLTGVRQHYDSLSERCHPNSFGQQHFFSRRDRLTNAEYYSDLADLDRHFDVIFAGAMLIEFFESRLDRLDPVILKVVKLQNDIEPVSKER